MSRTKLLTAATAVSIAAGAFSPAVTASAAPAPARTPVWTASAVPTKDIILTSAAQPDAHTTWAAGFQIIRIGPKITQHLPVLLTRKDGDARGWTATATAPLPAGSYTRINAVTAVSGRDGWLVGDDAATVGGIVTEHWNGAAWKLVKAPVPAATVLTSAGFLEVSGADSRDVWAVGWAQVRGAGDGPNGHLEGLVEHWNGTGWKPVPLPKLAGGWALNAVTEINPHDLWAVGMTMDDDQPVLLHSDGHAWTQVPTPRYRGVFGEFNAVAARGPNDVWAVGRAMLDPVDTGVGHALVEHWNGHTWQQVATPSAAGRIASVALTSQGVTVVGRTTLAPYPGPGSDGYAMRFSDGTWQPLGLPAGTLFDPSGVVVSPQHRTTIVGEIADPTRTMTQSMTLTSHN
ncbi:hypothetical protein EDD99_0919 [Streptomyces sp. 846.5]|nr:hypothetical protein [Streptomyces sp. 846.5]TDU02521.1 hypothetical protein EDD99_0919 [Streptomyces sp. 846.5]